jgi:hypothetical protein
MLRDTDSLFAEEIDWDDASMFFGWTSGWFLWQQFTTPAFVTCGIGTAGDIIFPVTCRWSDFDYHRMFYLRYSSARQDVELLQHHEDAWAWEVEAAAQMIGGYDLDQVFKPDVLFAHLTEQAFPIKMITPKQAKKVSDDSFSDAPGEIEVWRPADIGQSPHSIEWATDGELQIAS